jgi:hypothetical protein
MNLKSQDRSKKRVLSVSPAGIALRGPAGDRVREQKTPDVQSPKEESFENISGSIPLLVDATKGGRELFNSSVSLHPHHNVDRQALITRYYSFILLKSKVI